MPRALRMSLPGVLFHVIVRAEFGRQLFIDHQDCETLLKIISELKKRKPFKLYAYCLMADHIHLLIEPLRDPLPKVMQAFLTRYVKVFQIRHGLKGHILQGRYRAILCQKSRWLRELVRYIHLNPVRSGYEKDPTSWPWTGHAQYLHPYPGAVVDAAPVLAKFSRDAKEAAADYGSFIQSGMKEGHRADYYPLGTFPVLGDKTFQRLCRKRMSQNMARPEPSLSLRRLAAEDSGSISLELLRSKSHSRKIAAARGRFIMNALKERYSSSEIAGFLRLSRSAISKVVSRRLSSNI